MKKETKYQQLIKRKRVKKGGGGGRKGRDTAKTSEGWTRIRDIYAKLDRFANNEPVKDWRGFEWTPETKDGVEGYVDPNGIWHSKENTITGMSFGIRQPQMDDYGHSAIFKTADVTEEENEELNKDLKKETSTKKTPWYKGLFSSTPTPGSPKY